ncbi:MAG: DUF4214 domain-containing protein [Acidimicrobiales bacterium]|nr:DUF4214 domain-containing protein [Acidimicrobiales bacterium]
MRRRTVSRRARLCAALAALLVLVLVLASVAPAGSAAAQAAPLPPDGPWLDVVNLYRATAGLAPVGVEPSWSDGGALHARYMAQHGLIAHGEDPRSPWYTPAGAAAGEDSNIGPGDADWTDRGFIESFMTAPFHAFGVLRPGLRTVGYGAYRDPGAPLTGAATLDVIRGLDQQVRQQQPILWPGPDATVPLTSFDLETPDPLTACPGWTPPAGLPIVVLLPEAPGPVSASVTQGDRALPVCVITADGYRHPDPSWQEVGRALLDFDDAVIVIPRDPLDPGVTYLVSVTTAARRLSWSFTSAEQLAPHPVPPAVTDLGAAVDGGAVRLAWTPVAGAASYRVIRSGRVLATVVAPPYVDRSAPQGLGSAYQVIAVGPFLERQREPSAAVAVAPGADEATAAAVAADRRGGNPFVTVEAYIGRQHRDLVGRPASTGDLAMWAKQVRMRLLSPLDVTVRLLRSSGYGGLAAPLVRLHLAANGRVPDAPWLLQQLAARRAGTALLAIAEGLAASPEVQARFGGGDDGAFVDRAYQVVLDRPADAGGLAFWTSLLGAGRVTRAGVILGLAEAGEHALGTWRTAEVTLAYVGLLRRAPDPGALAFWSATPAPLDQVAWALVTSGEYAARFRPVEAA